MFRICYYFNEALLKLWYYAKKNDLMINKVKNLLLLSKLWVVVVSVFNLKIANKFNI